MHTLRSRHPRVALGLLVLLAAACDTPAPRAPDSAQAPAVAATRDTVAPRARLALDGEGFRLVDAVTGSARAIAFGTADTVALAAISAAVGGPTGRALNADCGAGPIEIVSFGPGLQAHVQRGQFVGWSARPATGAVAQTMSGVGPGSTRAELEGAYAATVRQTTLGTEFSAGGLQGVLGSPADSARITDMWAGASCVAR